MKTILSRFNANYFFTIPPETQIIWFWLGFFVLSLGATVALFLYFRKKGKIVRPYRLYAKNFLWPNLTLTIVGIVLAFSRYEKLALFSWRFWIYVVVLALIVFNVWYFMVKRNQLEDQVARFYDSKRKEKWLTKSKK